MKTDSIEFRICPNCGSTDCIEDYPDKGKQICVKCGHKSVKIKLKVVETEREISDQCPFCGKEGEEDETLLETDNMIVFRCKKCGKLDGYKFPDVVEYDPEFGRVYDSLSVKIAKQEGKSIYSARRAKEFEKSLRKKEKDAVEKCKKRLNLLVHKKIREMNAAGISTETINSARRKVVDYLEGKPVTHKQLTSLLAAAIYEASHEDLIGVSGFKRIGEKVSHRQLEKIFGVTRKTIRKWRNYVPRRTDSFYL
jgi:transcription elongation factor Elf1